MSNFTFLKGKIQYQLFAPAAIEAEKVFATSPAICAIGTRKALELAVKWVFAADPAVLMPYRDNLQSLVHEESFKLLMDNALWRDLQVIIRLGNLAVHTERSVSSSDCFLQVLSGKSCKQKWRKVNLQNGESCRHSLLIVTKGSKNWIPVRPALHLSRGLRGISSPVPGFGIPRSS